MDVVFCFFILLLQRTDEQQRSLWKQEDREGTKPHATKNKEKNKEKQKALSEQKKAEHALHTLLTTWQSAVVGASRRWIIRRGRKTVGPSAQQRHGRLGGGRGERRWKNKRELFPRCEEHHQVRAIRAAAATAAAAKEEEELRATRKVQQRARLNHAKSLQEENWRTLGFLAAGQKLRGGGNDSSWCARGSFFRCLS